MICPRCHWPLVHREVRKVELEECTGCRHFWFDLGELHKLRPVLGSHDFAALFGENDEPPSRCPACEEERLLHGEIERVPVWYCRACHGFFATQHVLDAQDRPSGPDVWLQRFVDYVILRRKWY